MMQLVLETEESFFVTDASNKTHDFVENVIDTVNKLFFEVPVENPSVKEYAFRQSRLKMTKFRIETQTVQWNIETLNTLRNAKIALSIWAFLSISTYLQVAFFPHAIQEQVNEILKKKMVIKDHLESKLKEWMPCQDFVCLRNGVDYVVIEDLAWKA